MKTKLFFTLLLIICISDIFSQTPQWRLLAGSPGISGISRNEDIYFMNQNTGWCVGYQGEVYRTTNGGNIWQTIFHSTFGTSFRSVGFFDSTTGLLGTLNYPEPIFYRTTNSGYN
ncbi:MAG: hypothetical protein ABI840_11790, partial [bacterium]